MIVIIVVARVKLAIKINKNNIDKTSNHTNNCNNNSQLCGALGCRSFVPTQFADPRHIIDPIISGFYADNGKENGNYYSGLYRIEPLLQIFCPLQTYA